VRGRTSELANIKSQKKRNRTNELARVRNKSVRSELKTAEKKVDEAVAAGDFETADAAYADAARLYDVAVRKGVVHTNHAANHKSRMARHIARARA
jgi:small subunit ribosomal protein S20